MTHSPCGLGSRVQATTAEPGPDRVPEIAAGRPTRKPTADSIVAAAEPDEDQPLGKVSLPSTFRLSSESLVLDSTTTPVGTGPVASAKRYTMRAMVAVATARPTFAPMYLGGLGDEMVAPVCGRTFELSRPRRRAPLGRGRTIYTMAWSGQAVAAVAGRRLERGVRPHSPAPWPRTPRSAQRLLDHLVCPQVEVRALADSSHWAGRSPYPA
jgi:hypothetical protein